MAIEVVDLSWRDIDRASWDDLALRAGSSYQLAYGRLSLWRIMLRVAGVRLRFLQLRADGTPIGLCVVSSKGLRHQVRERLLLLPEFEAHWSRAMRAVLAHIGPGSYVYGHSVSIASARHSDLEALSGVTLKYVSPYFVQAVDFSAFEDWDDYWKKLKGNIKRNFRRADEEFDLSLSVHTGSTILRRLPAYACVKVQQDRHFAAQIAALRDLRGLAVLALGLGDNARLQCAMSQGRPLSWQYFVRFGNDDYYVAAATRRLQPSPAWWLTVRALQEAAAHSRDGRVVLGPFYPEMHDGVTGNGLLQWRRFCQAQDFPSSIVRFEWRA